MLTIISVNSPRRFDEAMTDGLMAMAEHGQPAVVTPFTLMGAMTPVTLAAALVQQNAEALAGIALTQLVRPGAPVVYGAFTSNVDLRSGAPAFGTPENARATIAAGQLARRYGIPYRASNASASNALDAQAAYESQMSIWSSVLGGAHLVYHGAGWMEGGLTASFEKIVLDVEMLQMMALTIAPVTVDEAEVREGLDAIAGVPTGGHFFGSPHTLERYESAFYEPLVSNWQNYESWEEAGSLPAEERATAGLAGGARALRAAAARRGSRGAPRRVRRRGGGSSWSRRRRSDCGSSTSSASTTAASRRSASTPTRPTARAIAALAGCAGRRCAPYEALERFDADALVLSGSTDPWAATTRPRSSGTTRCLRAFDGPVLGICAGMQNLVRALGGSIGPAARPAHGFAPVEVVDGSDLLSGCCALVRRCASVTTTRSGSCPRTSACSRRARPALSRRSPPATGPGGAHSSIPRRGTTSTRRAGSWWSGSSSWQGARSVNHGTAALARGLAVLEALADVRRWLRTGSGVMRLSELVGGDKSQLSRTLKTLEERG